MRNIIHIALIISGLIVFGSPVFAQKKSKEDKVSYRERKKFDRLFIDAGKAKILGDYEQAVKLFEACVKIDPDQEI